MRARFIQEIGTSGKLRIYWDTVTVTEVVPCSECKFGHVNYTNANSCPNTYGTKKPGIHNAYTELGTVAELAAWKAFGGVESYPEDKWPTVCADCGAPVPQNVTPIDNKLATVGETGIQITRQVFHSRLYNTKSGQPEPGDVYYLDWHEPGHCPFWNNCDGRHIYSLTPNGEHWDITSRASNCTLKDDRTHRCWITHGSPEDGTLHVDKNGTTCAAGAGSIQVTGWHGFLHNFEWNP